MSELRAKLNLETAQVRWVELARFFARGEAIFVDEALNLLDVAVAVAEDRNDEVAGWMSARQVLPVPDEQALVWQEADALVWTVVVRPWVLVQSPEATPPEQSSGGARPAPP